jgi:hypothetical protein
MKKLNISAPRKQKEKNKEIPCKADNLVWKDQETLSLPNHLETGKMETRKDSFGIVGASRKKCLLFIKQSYSGTQISVHWTARNHASQCG